MKNNITLIITGSINIEGFNVPSTILTNLKERLQQYIESIEYAIINYKTITNIIFCDNTNYQYDYSQLYEKAKLFNKNIEILSFLGDYEFIQQRGKGYGEMEIFKYVYEHSVLIQNANYIVKITGRYKLLNLQKFLDYFCSNIKNADILVDLSRNLTFSDSRFFIVNKLFFNELFQFHEILDDSNNFFMEHVVCKATLSLILKGVKYKPFKFYPIYEGTFATKNIRYKTNVFYVLPRKVKYYLKYILLSR